MRPHVVLVHGSRLASSQWIPQRHLLAPYVDVTAIDLPGHGALAAEPFTLDGSVRVIQSAALAAAPAPVVVVGHSLGGYVALAHASVHSDSLAGTVLAGCSAVPVGPGAAAYRGVAALTARIGPARMTRFNDRALRRLYPAELIEPVIAGGYFFDATPDAWREVMAHCRPSMLRDVDCPVLLLNGRFDQFRLGVRAYLAACPQARHQVIPGASHLSNLDQPTRFADAVLDFVRETVTR